MRKILIATVSEATNTALSKALSQYEVHVCNTGAEALTMLEMLQPDILILDLMLPSPSGLTVLQKSGFRPRIILALTNLITPAALQAAAEAGVQDIILIPCTSHYIIRRLNALTAKDPSPEA